MSTLPDVSAPILRHARIFRDQLGLVEAGAASYLTNLDVRPQIAEPLLRLIVASNDLLEAVMPRPPVPDPLATLLAPRADEARAIMASDESTQVYTGPEEWSPYPWMHEKLSWIQQDAVRFAAAWLADPKPSAHDADDPTAATEDLHHELYEAMYDLKYSATKVLEMLLPGARPVMPAEPGGDAR